ncbi:MAG: alpha/beta hydrolase [bacterium]
MEFKAKKRNKTFYVKRGLLIISIIILSFILFIQIYSPIYIKNFEDLDVNAETSRVGGEYYKKDGDEMYVADYFNNKEKTILFIHGFAASSFSWRKNIDALGTDYHVISVDLLGFGMSKNTKSENIGLDRDVEIISSYLTEKKLKNVLVVGHSMGGVVAQKLAEKNKSQVIGLVLINSIDTEYMQKRTDAFGKNLLDLFFIKNPIIFVTYNFMIEQGTKKAYYNKDLVDKLTVEGYQKGYRFKGSSDQLVKFTKSSPPTNQDLSKISQLTLIYSSENDEIIEPENSVNISKKIPNSTLIKIPKAGHLLMEEQPTLINDGIRQWIEECFNKLNVA